MVDLETRAKYREILVKIARDSVVERAAKLYLAQYQKDLEFLNPGDQVPMGVPIGKDHFVKWVEYVLENHFPEVSGVIENEKIVKEYAVQIADSVAKSNTNVQNPLRDYEVSKDPIYVRADFVPYFKVAQQKSFTPSGSMKTPNLYEAPSEHSRYCPEHPGAMLKRIEDNHYMCPIGGDLGETERWKDKWDYNGGHEVRFEFGVQNQTNLGPSEVHPLLPFLRGSEGKEELSDAHKMKGKEYKIYDTENTLPERQSLKNAEIKSFTKQSEKIKREDGSYSERGLWDNIRDSRGSGKKPTKEMLEQAEKIKKEQASLLSFTKEAQQLYAPTTMMTRQCPDHPGQQLMRIEDNIRRCPLDGREYDFERGFTTDDGVRHLGGSVMEQNSFPPNFRLASNNEILKEAQLSDSPSVHEFLYALLGHLPGSAERERKILNYKFQKGVSLEQAIAAIKEVEELAKQPLEQRTSSAVFKFTKE